MRVHHFKSLKMALKAKKVIKKEQVEEEEGEDDYKKQKYFLT